MTTKKICFRYDGSEEAKEAIKLLNEKYSGKTHFSGHIDNFYDSDGNHWMPKESKPKMTLVTPAEFLRLVKGEPEWTPKYGEEVEVSDNLINWHKHTYIGKNPHNSALPYVIANVEGTIMPYKHIRPIRKSVREEITAILQQLRKDQISEHVQTVNPYTDRIIDIIKQRKDEL